MTDHSTLRDLAERASPGPWDTGCLGSDSRCQCTYIFDGGHAGGIATVHIDNGKLISDGGNDAPPKEEAIANMRFIAAANPEIIIALLDEIEAHEKYRLLVAEEFADYEREIEGARNKIKKLETALMDEAREAAETEAALLDEIEGLKQALKESDAHAR